MKLILDIWRALTFEVRMVAIAVAGGLIVLAVVLGQIGACRDRREEKKIERIGTNITTSQIEANVLTNTKREVEANAKNASVNVDRTFNTDSGTRDGDFGTVRKRWCEDHPGDSKCK